MARRRHVPHVVLLPSALGLIASLSLAAGCSHSAQPPASPRPSILLVTLDTTRADAIGPDAVGITTPSFNAIATRGTRFRQAYATVPETLPSHTSMMTGLYPAGHGIHENGRHLADEQPVLAAQLKSAGYRTAAFVSTFVLARQFGLARGFDLYNDDLAPGRAERSSLETTDAALAEINQPATQPRFIWVHYNDPHAPYEPPEPFKTRFAKTPYLGEVAAMDQQLGRLIQAFEQRIPDPRAVIIVADHGEGLGDHGELQHGNLLYQATMHVPLVVVGPGVAAGVNDTPVSTRRVFHTILDWAGLGAAHSLRSADPEVVLGEAMKPFLEYGWQPQVMSVAGHHKVILAGRAEAYDIVADAAETRDLAGGPDVPAAIRNAAYDYPVPAHEAARAPETLGKEEREKLASLGYVSSGSVPEVRKDAPRPADMIGLFGLLERASGLFVGEEYAQAIPLFEQILAADPRNLDATLRLATAHSALGHDAKAVEWFTKAAELSPKSRDVRLYLALHYARGKDWARAVPDLERIVAESPDRVPALEALAVIRERQGRVGDAVNLRQQLYRLRAPSSAEAVQLGQLAMQVDQTNVAIAAFEEARTSQGRAFAHDLELGVLYLAARRFTDARDALDRVPATHPEYPMVLFKRAQVSVLLHEPDAAARIDLAKRKADDTTRALIANERLFQGGR